MLNFESNSFFDDLVSLTKRRQEELAAEREAKRLAAERKLAEIIEQWLQQQKAKFEHAITLAAAAGRDSASVRLVHTANEDGFWTIAPDKKNAARKWGEDLGLRVHFLDGCVVFSWEVSIATR